MEGGGEEVAFADENREVVAAGEGFDFRADAGDSWGADEDHLEWTACEFCGCGEDGGVDLAAVGVAFDGDVEGSEGGLRGVFYLLCEEDSAGAGAEGWSRFDEGLECVEKTSAFQEFEEGGGLAAGDDEAIEVGELGWCADEPGGHAESGERFGMSLECALQGEDADGERAVLSGC